MAKKITTVITPYTTTPSRLKPSTFSSDRDIRLVEENIRNSQLNDIADEINDVAEEVDNNTLIALNSANAAAKQVVLAAAEVANATAQVVIATTKANESSASATLALQMRDETASLIELLPSDVNLAYSKAGTDALLAKRDLENFLDFKF